MDNYITFDSVSKSYGNQKVIDQLDLNIAQGEFISLLGPSGSGKTTLLMLLAGFEQSNGGRILVNGERVDQLPPRKRNMGVVFQNYALFPHLTVAENIAFPLKCRGLSKDEIRKKTSTALEMVRLSHLASHSPSQLSGGQQQRIALARALVFEPKVMLMDEPLGALDKQLREHMQLELRALHRSLGLTIIFVTHDQTEAITMSDRIAVFNSGKIEQLATPREIYFHPKTQFVADFIGETNMLPATVISMDAAGATLTLESGQHLTIQNAASTTIGEHVLISLRPESIIIDQQEPADFTLECSVLDFVFLGDHTRVHLNYQGTNLVARTAARFTDILIGQSLSISFPPDDCAVIRKS